MSFALSRFVSCGSYIPIRRTSRGCDGSHSLGTVWRDGDARIGKSKEDGFRISYEAIDRMNAENKDDPELDRVCGNCNHSFPTSQGGSDEAICLNDAEFEPYLDRLLDHADFDCCAELIARKQFPLDREACPDFDPLEGIGDDIEIASELSADVQDLASKGQLTPQTLKAVIAAEAFRRTDWSKAPVEEYVARLQAASTVQSRKEALNSIGWLIHAGNKAAFEALCAYLRSLPPARTPEDCHFRVEVLGQLSWRRETDREVAQLLVEDLVQTPSNQHTRPWSTEAWRFFEKCSSDVAEEAFQPILTSPRFSYRIRRRVRRIIEYGSGYADA